MNKKQRLAGMVIVIGCLMSSSAFADQDYRDRNVFNRFTDWTATMGKNSEDRQRVIDQRVDLRAQRREAYAHKHMQDNKTDKQYDQHMNDLDHKATQQEIDNDHRQQ